MAGITGKRKKVFITLFLFVFLLWLVTLQVKAGRFTFLEKPVLAVSGFFERVITGPYRFAESAGANYVLLVHTARENRRLKQEIGRLKLENAITNELLDENERLRDLIGFEKLEQHPAVAAEIIGKDVSPSARTITINKGTADGVAKEMAVVSEDGVVGKVQEALPRTALVILITDPGSTLAVRVQRNREEGLLEGKLERCALKYVSYYADIQEGDQLVTSGLDGIYPKGLPVARVTKVTKREASSFQAVTADPAVAFSRLEEVLVLTK